MEDYENRGLVPRLTAVLRDSAAGRMATGQRGAIRHTAKPVARAVVIGIGGSGIQTISRTRHAVFTDRPDTRAHNAISFLGIDAVPITGQNPPLPPDVTLTGNEFFNMQGFDASAYLAGQRPSDPFLNGWWDPDYTAPRGALTEGLKRERMLGRLCFNKHRSQIRDQVSTKVNQAMHVRDELVAQGAVDQAGGVIDVYVVASCAGGTGSSGFLEVLGAIHEAAQPLNIYPRIRAFLYLPAVFANEVLKQPNGAVAAQAHRANAYAFFKELDHFLVHGDEFAETIGLPPQVKVGRSDLLYQAFLFDSAFGDGGVITQIADMYEMVGEAIYQFLLTDMGRALVGVDGTNTDQALSMVDRFEKPRRYCSLGLSRIVYPGDTLRNHLVMRWCDWFVRMGPLRSIADQEADEMHLSPRAAELYEEIDKLVFDATSAIFDPMVDEFLSKGRSAPQRLRSDPEPETASELRNTLESEAPSVAREIRGALEVRRTRALEELRGALEEKLFGEGDSLPHARELLKAVSKYLRRALADAESSVNSSAASKAGSTDMMDEAMTELEEAAQRNPLEVAGAAVVALFGDRVKTQTEAAQAVGMRMREWAQALEQAEKGDAKRLFLSRACTLADRLTLELEAAYERLIRLAGRAKSQWEDDTMIGKDKGPATTTVFFPSDVVPEIEWSSVARHATQGFQNDNHRAVRGDELSIFYKSWMTGGGHRGFFDYGSDDGAVFSRAEDTLLALMEQQAMSKAVLAPGDAGSPEPRLPLSLVDAAQSAGEMSRLESSVRGIEGLSRNVAWSWEEGRFIPAALSQSSGSERPRPEVRTGVVHPHNMEAMIDGQFTDLSRSIPFDDPERVIALSCEWALPLHCLTVVDHWKRDYELLAANRLEARTRGMAIEPPNHIDHRFGVGIRMAEVVPDYIEPRETARLLARALLLTRLNDDASTRDVVARAFVRDATAPVALPLRRAPERGWFSRRILVDDGLLRADADSREVSLGRSWSDLFRSFGADMTVQASVRVTWEQLSTALGGPKIHGLVAEVLAERGYLAVQRRARGLSAGDRSVLAMLENEWRSLDDEYNTEI